MGVFGDGPVMQIAPKSAVKNVLSAVVPDLETRVNAEAVKVREG